MLSLGSLADEIQVVPCTLPRTLLLLPLVTTKHYQNTQHTVRSVMNASCFTHNGPIPAVL